MNSNQIQKLIFDLHTLSKSGKLNWQESATESSFILSFPTFSVVLDKNDKDPISAKYYVDIVNETGRTVESLFIESYGELHTVYALTGELYDLARKQALIEKTRKSGTISQCISREDMCHFYMVCP